MDSDLGKLSDSLIKLSPNRNMAFGVHIILEMLYILWFGSSAKAKTEIQESFPYILKMATFKETLNNYRNYSFLSHFNRKDKVSYGSAAFIEEDREIKDDFEQLIKRVFDYEFIRTSESNLLEKLNIVNNYISEKTRGKFPRFFEEVDTIRNKSFFLINALNFKVDWKYPFNKRRTKKHSFEGLIETGNGFKKEVVECDMMFREELVSYDEKEEFEMFSKKLYGETLEMFFLKPKGNIVEFIQKNDIFNIIKEFYSFKRMELFNIGIPKFTLNSETELDEILKKMNIKEIFSNYYSLQGITESNLKVDSFSQQILFEVDEEGAQVTCVTSTLECDSCAEPKEFILNKPFIFGIYRRNTILFVGKVFNIGDNPMTPSSS